MWAIVAILALVVVLFWTYMALAAQRHEREELKILDEQIDAKTREFETAMREHPDDFMLHGTLRRELLRLREERKSLR